MKVSGAAVSRPFHSIISEKSFPSAELTLASRNATAVSPFTQSVRINGGFIDYLSCVAYFEVKIEANLQGNGPISVGLANSQFPRSDMLVGGDVNSFGYLSTDGCLYHGEDTAGIHFGPAYDPGDTVGCGLIYPPLAANHGDILFTRNGEIVGVVELLDVGLIDVPWFPIVGMSTGRVQNVRFNIGAEEFRFPIFDFEYEEIKNRWGFDHPIDCSSKQEYCTNVYRTLSTRASASATSSLPVVSLEPPATESLKKIQSPEAKLNNKFYGSLNQARHSWIDNGVHEVPIRKRKFSDAGAEAEEDRVVYQRFKTWSYNESSRAGSTADSSSHDSWGEEEENMDSNVEGILSSEHNLIPSRGDSVPFLGSLTSDNESIDETQSCIAVEGEMTLAEYLQMAHSGIVVMQGADSLERHLIDEDIEIERPTKFEVEVEEQGEDEDEEEDYDDLDDGCRSIATSLFVEVNSVDSCGSYFGYGGSSESDEEFYALDHEEIASGGSVISETFYSRGSPQTATAEKSSRHKWKNKTSKEKKLSGTELTPSGRSQSSTLRSSSSNDLRQQPQQQRLARGRHHARGWETDPGSDGYEGASEMGRGYLTDGMEDTNSI